MRIGALDVQYSQTREGSARAASILYRDATCAVAIEQRVLDLTVVQPYESGEFYKRELPCLLGVLRLCSTPDLLVVDGYATLDPDGRPGLGAHLSDSVGLPVIGVSKSRFRTASHAAQVLRGRSSRPLYVTTAGEISIPEAAELVAGMAGGGRIPDAIRLVDRLARSGSADGATHSWGPE